jgi:hypothetical protein
MATMAEHAVRMWRPSRSALRIALHAPLLLGACPPAPCRARVRDPLPCFFLRPESLLRRLALLRLRDDGALVWLSVLALALGQMTVASWLWWRGLAAYFRGLPPLSGQ